MLYAIVQLSKPSQSLQITWSCVLGHFDVPKFISATELAVLCCRHLHLQGLFISLVLPIDKKAMTDPNPYPEAVFGRNANSTDVLIIGAGISGMSTSLKRYSSKVAVCS